MVLTMADRKTDRNSFGLIAGNGKFRHKPLRKPKFMSMRVYPACATNCGMGDGYIPCGSCGDAVCDNCATRGKGEWICTDCRADGITMSPERKYGR